MWKYCYYGFNKEEYDSCKTFRDTANLRNVILIAGISGVLEILLGIQAFLDPSKQKYGSLYLFYGIFTLTFLFLLHTLLPKLFDIKSRTTIIMYIFITLAYSFGILITIPSKDEKAILFIVALVLLSVLFVDNALRMAIYTIGICICYCILAYQVKNLDIARMDLYNVICFGTMALLVQYFVNKKIVAGFISTAKNKQLIQAYEKAQKELWKQAHTDMMTGLYNRTYFADKIPQFIKDAAQAEDIVYLVMLDLDKFKKINDIMGHQMGDQVIIGVAKAIMSGLQTGEYASRLGGDEFMFVLAGRFHQESLDKVVENILAGIRLIEVAEGWYASSSIGVTSIHMQNHSFEELYRITDKVLYDAKQMGGNQIVYAEALGS